MFDQINTYPDLGLETMHKNVIINSSFNQMNTYHQLDLEKNQASLVLPLVVAQGIRVDILQTF